MTARPTITVDQRRARLGVRHRLAPGTRMPSVAEAAGALVVIHASDSASAFLQARARTTLASPAEVEEELYEGRSVLRMLAMRRTLFLVSTADVPTVNAAASIAIARTERKRTLKMLEGAGIGPDPAQLLEDLEAIGLAAVRERGEATTAELTALDPRLAMKIVIARGKSYEGRISVSQKVFFHLALDGHIGRGRPRGTWVASQFRWSPIERWLPHGIETLDVDDARAELAGRWLRAFGPGTRNDLKWWTGWPVGAVDRALKSVGAVEVDLGDGAIGYAMGEDLEPVEPPEPWVALLPALDATTMGWADRDWYLGPHRDALFDSNGNAGPTIWADGRIVGGWAQRPSGAIATFLLEKVGRATQRAIAREAEGLGAWIGPTRIRGSFPTPLETELRESS